MIDILDSCLKQYHYAFDEKIQYDNIKFYKNDDRNIASYFLINSVDCAGFETDGDKMKSALEKLEIEYSTNGEYIEKLPLKIAIQNSFGNNKEASQIDKNTSAIYLIKFNNMENLNLHRNLVYAIEESPNYFKRYILPYTEKQADGLRNILNDHHLRKINEVLSEIANDEDEYYKLMEGKNIGSVYELVIRLFSKIPFLQYQFSASTMPKPIEEDIIQKINDKGLGDYHEAIEAQQRDLKIFLDITSGIEDEKIEKELNSLLEE